MVADVMAAVASLRGAAPLRREDRGQTRAFPRHLRHGHHHLRHSPQASGLRALARRRLLASARDVRNVSDDLIGMTYAQRVAQPCIGQERADLVLAGCAILEALLRIWPCQRLRVADRGLREGILATLMAEDGHDRSAGQPAARTASAASRFARPERARPARRRRGHGPRGWRRPPSAAWRRSSAELAAMAATSTKASGKSPATTSASATAHALRTRAPARRWRRRPRATSCCATLAKLVARLIALESISA